MKKLLLITTAFIASWCVAIPVYGAQIVDSGVYTGSSSERVGTASGGPIVAAGNFAYGGSGPGFKVDWTIIDLGASGYNYEYTISKSAGVKLDQFYIEVDPSITSFGSFSNVLLNGSATSLISLVTETPSGAPVASGSIHALRLSTSDILLPITLSFTSQGIPVWGDFFAREGGVTRAYNTGYWSDPTASDSPFANWVPTVGAAAAAVPEPSTYLILGTCLFFGIALRRVREQRA